MAEPTRFECRTERRGARHIVRAEGDLDLATRDTLIGAVCTALDAGAAEVELNLAGVRFCDSTGLSGLIAAERIAATQGVRVYVTEAREQVRSLLATTAWTARRPSGEELDTGTTSVDDGPRHER